MDGLCLSVVNDVIGKIEIRMLGEETLASVKVRCEFSFEGKIVEENCFHTYDPQNHAVLYIAKNIYFSSVYLISEEQKDGEFYSLGYRVGVYWEDPIKGSVQKYTIRIIKSLSFSLTPKLSEHSGYRNDPFVHCSRNCINVDYFQ
jgi:hypothetical protein